MKGILPNNEHLWLTNGAAVLKKEMAGDNILQGSQMLQVQKIFLFSVAVNCHDFIDRKIGKFSPKYYVGHKQSVGIILTENVHI